MKQELHSTVNDQTIFYYKYNFKNNNIPELVVNSISLALTDLTNESEIIIGVNAKSHPYLC